jgi:hypothetical protein
MPQKKAIALIGEDDTQRWRSVISLLADSCGLSLCELPQQGPDRLAGVVTFGKAVTDGFGQSVSRFRLIPVISSFGTSVPVRFGMDSRVPEPFRKRTLNTACVIPELPDSASGIVMASVQERPVWISSLDGGQRQDTCWVAADGLVGAESVFDRLNGSRFMDLLPLLEWMRSLSGYDRWERPPTRACLMFDDPNLHSLHYGYIDFRRVAQAGREHGFHTAFATVPFDSWYVNGNAARCFREHPDTISLLVHGNNHTRRELTGGRDQADRRRQMRQALQRIERLDRKAGVRTSRIMAPPHGACSEAMMRAMCDVGFEAACISPGSVRGANPGAPWTGSLGLHPSAIIGDFPVMPRFRLDARCEGAILLAAYLDQPVIPVGHHWDLAEGMGLLEKTADIMNGLGGVVWGDLATLSRCSYRRRIEDGCLWLRPYARFLRVEVPEGINEIRIEAPWLQESGDRFVPVTPGRTWCSGPDHHGDENGPGIKVVPGSQVDLDLRRTEPPPFDGDAGRTPPAAVVRRLLVEVRDRSMPYLPERWQRR